MQLSIDKIKDQYKLNIIKEDGNKEKFEQIKFINMIYEGEKVEKINYGNNITEEEKEQIQKMINDINAEIKKAHQEHSLYFRITFVVYLLFIYFSNAKKVYKNPKFFQNFEKTLD